MVKIDFQEAYYKVSSILAYAKMKCFTYYIAYG